jgi:hypothetical protein
VWAEIVEAYKAGEKWHLDDDVEALAKEIQTEHTERNGKQGVIESFLEILLPEDWDKRTLEERFMFYDGGFGSKEIGTVQRKRICAMEIWLELFRGEMKFYTPQQSREITSILKLIKGWRAYGSTFCGKPYDRQRAFIRDDGVKINHQIETDSAVIR